MQLIHTHTLYPSHKKSQRIGASEEELAPLYKHTDKAEGNSSSDESRVEEPEEPEEEPEEKQDTEGAEKKQEDDEAGEKRD